MARSRARTPSSLVLASLLAQATPSFADGPPSSTPATVPTKGDANMAPKLDLEGPEAEAKDRARVLFQQGVAAYREGKFYDAVQIFLQTQRIYPDTQLLFNVARAYENLGNASAALRYYRDYLRQADRPSDGAEVRERVRRLEQQLSQRGVQQLTVLSQPESATVVLDGKPVGITPWTGETYPGKHRLALTLERYVGQEQVIEVDAYAAHDVSLVLLAEPKPLPPAPLPAPRAPRQSGVSLASLVTLGTGVALLGGALLAEAASNQPGMARTTAFFAGSGLGVTGVGCVMLYFDLSPRAVGANAAPSREKDSAALRP
ncbi:MAG TPA: PEGA domain-containing protein [Polyangiaceae bacterium]|nr:PEGA domain-containing protein [Polyangiaceae bacterium]